MKTRILDHLGFQHNHQSSNSIEKMTVNGRKYSLPTRIKDIMRFQETFPSKQNLDVCHSKRASRSLTPSPTHGRRIYPSPCESMNHIESISENDLNESITENDMNESISENDINESISENDINNPVYLVRSNSWTGCRRGIRLPMNHLTIRTTESHRSSTVSLPDVIEEDSSEEEFHDDVQSIDYDYMSCAGCRSSNLSTSLDSISSDNSSSNEISYCYKCKHLFQGKTKSTLCVPQIMNSDNRRGIPWTCQDAPYSPRASRKNSNNGNELPIISEPSIDDESNDNEELQQLVKNEVDRLIKFNTITVHESPQTRTIPCVRL